VTKQHIQRVINNAHSGTTQPRSGFS